MNDKIQELQDLIEVWKMIDVWREHGFDSFYAVVNFNKRMIPTNSKNELSIEITEKIQDILDMYDNGNLNDYDVEYFKPLFQFWMGGYSLETYKEEHAKREGA